MVKKNKKIWLLLFVLILSIIIIIIGFFPIPHSSLKKKAVEVLRRKTASDSCAVGKVSLTVFRGLSITDLLLIKKIDNRMSMRIELPVVKIDYRLLRTVFNFKKYQAALQSTPKKIQKKKKQNYKKHIMSLLYSGISKSDTLLSCVKTIHLERGRISIDSLEDEIVNIEEIFCTIRVKKSDPLCLKVKLSAEEIARNKALILRPHIVMSLDGSHCVIKKFTGRPFGGKIKGKFDLDLLHDRINSGRFDLMNMELEKWYSIQKDSTGILKGKCSLIMMIDTSGTEFPLLKGRGNIKLTNVSADEIPLVNKLAILTELSGLSHLRFKELTGDFVVKEGKIWSDNIKGKGDPLSVSITGWIRPEDTYFDFDMRGVFASYYKDSVSAIVWNTLLPEEDGRRTFKCTVYGTPESPNVSFDKEIARRAVGSVFRTIGQEIKSIFRKRK